MADSTISNVLKNLGDVFAMWVSPTSATNANPKVAAGVYFALGYIGCSFAVARQIAAKGNVKYLIPKVIVNPLG